MQCMPPLPIMIQQIQVGGVHPTIASHENVEFSGCSGVDAFLTMDYDS